MTDNSGALVGATAYDAFGAIRSQSGTPSNLGYTGEQYTAATGLLHLRARDLNPTLGRFLSGDTVRPNAPGSQGYNLYAYVANNPTTLRQAQGKLGSTHRAMRLGLTQSAMRQRSISCSAWTRLPRRMAGCWGLRWLACYKQP